MKKTHIRGIKNFRIHTDFFNSPEMIIMQGRYGIIGPMFTMLLLCEIYANGYFLRWSWLRMFTLLRSMPGVDEHTVGNMLCNLAELGVIDREMLKKNIITSAEIQSYYFSRRRPKADVEYEYLLIDLNAPKADKKSQKNADEEKDYMISEPRTNVYKQPAQAAPSIDQVKAAVKSEEMAWTGATETDAAEFHQHYSARGWRGDDGRPIANWQYLLLDWLSQKDRKAS